MMGLMSEAFSRIGVAQAYYFFNKVTSSPLVSSVLFTIFPLVSGVVFTSSPLVSSVFFSIRTPIGMIQSHF